MDPTQKNKTISMIKGSILSLSPSLQIVAKYIVDQSSDFGLDSIRETARKCGVSTYTLVRLAKTLDFDSYEEMRAPFRRALVSSSPVLDAPDWIDALRGHGELGEAQAEAGLNTMSIVQRSLERQTAERMEHVAQLLLQAETVYLTAVRASYAMAYYFNYVGRMALPSLQLIPRHMNNAMDELNDAAAGDVMIAITFTPYSRETIEACKFAHQRGVKIILISDSDMFSPEFTAAETLVVSTLSTHHFGCYAGAMAVIENLLALLVRLGGDAAKQRITSYEDLRRGNNAYWIAQKKTLVFE